jgi:hypothetical protein
MYLLPWLTVGDEHVFHQGVVSGAFNYRNAQRQFSIGSIYTAPVAVSLLYVILINVDYGAIDRAIPKKVFNRR